MKFTFPLKLSKFIRKRNAAYDGDPNGDYVVAEDVNELQESIERLEEVVGIETLTDTIADSLKGKADKTEINDFGSPIFINYGGSPLNTYDTIEKRISAFSYVPMVMLKKDSSSSFDYFTKEISSTGSRLFGSINVKGMSLNAVMNDVSWFKTKLFDGIYLQSFGYEDGLTRAQQNQLLDFIHARGMVVVVTGEIETTLFNKPHAKNPMQEPLKTSKDDFYLAQNIFVKDGAKVSPAEIASQTFNLNKAQKEMNIQILVEDSADFNADNNKLYLHGKMMATLFNLDGYSLAPVSRYGLNEKVQTFLKGFELGKWKVTNPIYVEETKTTSRSFSKGTLIFNKQTNECYVEGVGVSPVLYSWADKQIPGKAVDLASADFGSV